MNNRLRDETAVPQFALAALALAAAVLLAWFIYNPVASCLPDVHSTSVVGPSARDLWWWLGGLVAGAIAASAVLTLWWIAVSRESALALSVGSNLCVAIGSILIAGGLFPGIHTRQHRHQEVAEEEFSSRIHQTNLQEQARAEAETTQRQQNWDAATQSMAQLEAGTVASTLAAAEAQSPRVVLTSLRDGFMPFLDRHAWRTLSDDDRTAFSAFARRALNTMGGQDTDASFVLGMVIGAEHGLADTRGGMDECARLHALNCWASVGSLALYLCRNGPSCLDGYEGMDFVKLSKDISGNASSSCWRPGEMRDTQLCAYVRGEKH